MTVAPALAAGAVPPLQDPAVRRVALVRLRVGIGDLLCSAPALRALRVARPDLHLTIVTWPEMAGVVTRLGSVDELLAFPGFPGIPERAPDPDAWLAFAAAATEQRFDLAVQCYGDNPAANAVAQRLAARRVGGFAPTRWAPPRGTESIHLRYPNKEHEIRRHLLLMQRLGVQLAADAEQLSFPVTEAEETRMRTSSRATRCGRGPTPSCTLVRPAPSRRWPVESFADLAARLYADGLSVVATGSGAERGLVAELVRRSPVPVLDLCGCTDLGGLALLLRDSSVLVGNDTGTAHLAAAVGGRSVTIFQPGDPVRWGYEGPRSRFLAPEVACAPCAHLECPIDFRCSRATTPRRVMSAVREVAGA